MHQKKKKSRRRSDLFEFNPCSSLENSPPPHILYMSTIRQSFPKARLALYITVAPYSRLDLED